MKKLTFALIFVMLMSLVLPLGILAGAEGGEPSSAPESGESLPMTDKLLDFSSPISDELKSFLSFTPKTARAEAERVFTADGEVYYRLAHVESELDTAEQTTYTNISLKTDLNEMSYVVLEYDLKGDGEMYDGLFMFPIARDEDSNITSKGSNKVTYCKNSDGTFYVESTKGDKRYMGSSDVWHNYTWIFEIVSYSPVNTIMDAHVFIDGEYFTTFDSWINPQKTKYFSMLRLNAPLTAKAGEGIAVDNVRGRAYDDKYVGGIDKILDGTYSSVYDWEESTYRKNHAFAGEGAYAKLGDVYYATLDEAIATAEDGDEIIVLRTPSYPVLVNKAVKLLSVKDNNYKYSSYANTVSESFMYSSFTYKATYENGTLTFTEAASSDKLSVSVNGTEQTFSLGSYPAYTNTGLLKSYEKDGKLYELTGYKVNGVERSSLSPLSATDVNLTVEAVYNTLDPLFSVTKNGSEKLYYSEYDLYSISRKLTGGETVKLLSDITAENSYPMLKVTDGKTVNFDFNGHSVKCERATTFFAVSGEDSVLNVYSSVKGATFFGKTRGENTGSTFVDVMGSKAVCNLGDFGEHDGDNLSVYTAILANIGGLYATGELNISGGSYYRSVNYGMSFVNFVSGGKLVIDRAMLVGVDASANFDLAADGFDSAPSNVLVKNSSIINLDRIDPLVQTLPLLSSFRVESTLCYRVSYMAGSFVKGSDDDEGRMVFDRYCTFDENLSKFNGYEYITLADGLNTVAQVNRAPDKDVVYNSFGEEHDYTLLPTDKEIGANYIFYENEDEVVEIDWDFFGQVTSQVWLLGETPIAPFAIPENGGGIIYSMPEIVPAEEYAFYSVSMSRDFDAFMNLTLYNKLDVLAYIPTSLDYASVSFGGAAVNLASLDKLTLDGIEYYVLNKTGIEYSNAGTDYALAIRINAARGQVFACTLNVSCATYIKSVLDSAEVSASDKTLAIELVTYIDKKYTELGKTCPSKIKDLLAVPTN